MCAHFWSVGVYVECRSVQLKCKEAFLSLPLRHLLPASLETIVNTKTQRNKDTNTDKKEIQIQIQLEFKEAFLSLPPQYPLPASLETIAQD